MKPATIALLASFVPVVAHAQSATDEAERRIDIMRDIIKNSFNHDVTVSYPSGKMTPDVLDLCKKGPAPDMTKMDWVEAGTPREKMCEYFVCSNYGMASFHSPFLNEYVCSNQYGIKPTF